MHKLDTLWRNLRHGFRLLAGSPGFTAPASLTLALGIGANTAVFSVVKSVLLTPLPYGAPDELVMVWKASGPGEVTHLSLQELMSYRDNVASFQSAGGYLEANVNLTGSGDAERVRAGVVTGELLSTLGVPPLLGRVLAAADTAPGAPPVVVLGHGLWVRRFGRATAALGATLMVNGTPRTIVGVMPAGFRLPVDYFSERPTEIWIPETITPGNLGAWGDRSHFGVARLRPGATPHEATTDLALVADRWVLAGFVRDLGDRALYRSAIPLGRLLTGEVRGALFVLLGTVLLVLLVACANVMNLLLARADARRRDIALRKALGASRRDIVGQLLTESVLLAALGGTMGIGLGWAAVRVLHSLRPAGLPRLEEAALDAGTLGFTAVLSVATAVVFGLLPSVQLARRPLTALLGDSGRAGSGRTRRLVRRGLVAAQLALSVVLVIGAGLLLRSLAALYRVEVGFRPGRVLTAQLILPAADYPDETVVPSYRTLIQRLEQLPGVEAAAAIRILPLSRSIGDWSISIEGRETGPNENPNGDFQWATPGYQRVMGLTVLRGRWLAEADREDAAPVVVINDTMAARYWPALDPLGRRFRMGGPGATTPLMTIVGIVSTVRHESIIESPRAEMYLPRSCRQASAAPPGRWR